MIRRHKFGAVRTNGHRSKLEAAVRQILDLRQRAGEISDIKCEQSVLLGTETVLNLRTGKSRTRNIQWKVDFSFIEVNTNTRVWCEAKGVETRLYRKQLRLWREGAGPGKLEIWKGDWRRPELVEVVIPKQGEVNG